MFNIGPLELLVLAIVGIVVLGPERLPGLAKEAAQLIKTLREMATGAREQLREELGPEFADVDFRNLNPRVALQRAVLGDDFDLDKIDPRRFNARGRAQDLIFGGDSAEPDSAGSAGSPDGSTPVSMDKPRNGSAENGASPNGASANGTSANGASVNGGSANGSGAPRPRPRPRPLPAPFDEDAT